MASTYKTNALKLNKWVESDIPQMEDFNSDNDIVDRAVSAHVNDLSIHITDNERQKWNKGYGLQAYTGTGTGNQNITLNFGFDPTFCIVFSTNATPGIIDIPNTTHYNYFGIATIGGSNPGLSLSDNVLTVTSSSVMISKYEMRSYNELGKSYLIIGFR